MRDKARVCMCLVCVGQSDQASPPGLLPLLPFPAAQSVLSFHWPRSLCWSALRMGQLRREVRV